MNSLKLTSFIPEIYHKIYDEISKNSDDYTFLILKGGRSSGKGSAVYISLILSLALSTEKRRVRIYAPKKQSIRFGVFAQVKATIGLINSIATARYICYKSTVAPFQIRFTSGNVIDFDGLVDGSKGVTSDDIDAKYDLVIFDELAETKTTDTLYTINATIQTFLRENCKFVFIGNPPKNKKHWFNDLVTEYKKRDDTLLLHTNARDVPKNFNSDVFWKNVELMKNNENIRYRHEILGESVGLSGLIYQEFNNNNIMADIVDYNFSRIIAGLDYGQMNATVFSLWGIDFNKKIYVNFAEWSHSGAETHVQLAPSEYAKKIVEFIDSFDYHFQPEKIIIDPSAKGLGEEIKKMTNIKLKNADNTVILGIDRCNKLIAQDKLLVNKSGVSFNGYKNVTKSSRIFEELPFYEWNSDKVDKGKEEPIKELDHALDAMRYSVMHNWKYLEREISDY